MLAHLEANGPELAAISSLTEVSGKEHEASPVCQKAVEEWESQLGKSIQA